MIKNPPTQTPTQDVDFWNSEESLQRYAEMDFSLYDVEWQYLGKAVEQLGKKAEEITILDLGCGGGRTTLPLHTAGFDVIGVDIAENLIKHLQKTHPQLSVEVGDASHLRFDNRTFDIVLFSHNSLDCLFPIEKRREAIQEIGRVLKNGGFFIFSSHVVGLLPYSFEALKNMITNANQFIRHTKGYYKETMRNGQFVDLYYSNPEEIRKEMEGYSFELVQYSRFVHNHSTIMKTLLSGVASWETYYLCRKK